MHNHGKRISRVFQTLAQFPLTTGESKLDYYHEKVKCELPHELPNDLGF